MKKILLLFVVAQLLCIRGFSQEIKVEKSFWGVKYTQNDRNLRVKQIEQDLKKHNISITPIKKAKSELIVSSIVNFSSGALIGVPLGQLIAGKKAHWALAGLGCGLYVIGNKLYSGAHKKIIKSVEMYNSKLNPTTRYEVRFNITHDGVGMSFIF